MRWQGDKIVSAVVHSDLGGKCRIRTPNPVVVEGAEERPAAGVNPNPIYAIQPPPRFELLKEGVVKPLTIRQGYSVDFQTTVGGVYMLFTKK